MLFDLNLGSGGSDSSTQMGASPSWVQRMPPKRRLARPRSV